MHSEDRVAELVFSASDLAETRFAVSPMWEVGTSFRLLRSGGSHPVHQRWLDQVRPRVAAAGLDRGWLAELIASSGYVPDFVNPAPDGPSATLDQELSGILNTPEDRVRRDLDRLGVEQGSASARVRALRDQPHHRLPHVVEEIRRYWELALAPYWGRIRAVLEADIAHRARQAVEHGTRHLFNDLHASVRWTDDTLRLARRQRALDRTTSGPGLLLIPSAFTGPDPYTLIRPPDPPQLAYPARGTGTLWESRSVRAAPALATVLGRTRALLLSELELPATTTDLAERTGLTAPAISQHLTTLRDAGLVSAHRHGRFVLYARTVTADVLVEGG
ncbi:regulatory protein, arsR family [Asanoa hainanensis]|uniref:Regulatory protein, arsR family n=1 Tax=Asanoa hainanensis TaxID=560556 RepID=A0A239M8K4_9ACTN|nr:ArsR family transcriptional regulator [Asanoa hainanensis]SNT38139.1 regulatory protein, arsR family [Asanoa hainanensis]